MNPMGRGNGTYYPNGGNVSASIAIRGAKPSFVGERAFGYGNSVNNYDPDNAICHEPSIVIGDCDPNLPASNPESCCHPDKLVEVNLTACGSYHAYRVACGKEHCRVPLPDAPPPEGTACHKMLMEYLNTCAACSQTMGDDGGGGGGEGDGDEGCGDGEDDCDEILERNREGARRRQDVLEFSVSGRGKAIGRIPSLATRPAWVSAHCDIGKSGGPVGGTLFGIMISKPLGAGDIIYPDDPEDEKENDSWSPRTVCRKYRRRSLFMMPYEDMPHIDEICADATYEHGGVKYRYCQIEAQKCAGKCPIFCGAEYARQPWKIPGCTAECVSCCAGSIAASLSGFQGHCNAVLECICEEGFA